MAVLIVLALCGCAVKYTPSLHEELSEEGTQLLIRYGLRIEKEAGSLAALEQYTKEDSPAVAINYQAGYRTGFQCDDPLVSVLTLGIVPADCAQNIAVLLQIREGARVDEYEFNYRKVELAGWVAAVLPLFSGWEFGTGADSKERAMLTLINGAAQRRMPP